MGILNKWFAPRNFEKDKVNSVKMKKAQQDFVETAYETIDLTRNVTETLKDRLYDYETQINSVSHMMRDALIICDISGMIQSYNDATVSMFGYSDELKKMNLIHLFQLPYNDFQKFIIESMKSSKYMYEDFQCKSKDGALIYVDVCVSLMTKSDKSKYYIVVIRNVTERVLTLKKIYESEQRFKMFSKSSLEGIVILENDIITDCNSRFLKMTGYVRNNIIGFPIITLSFPGNDKKIGSLGEYQFSIKTSSNEPVIVQVTSNDLGDNKKILILSDISLFKSNEELLDSARQKYQNILNNNIDMLCCYDVNFMITYANQAFMEYFDIRDYNHLSIIDFIPDVDKEMFSKNIRNLTNEKPVNRSLYRSVFDDKIRWQDWIDRVVFDDKNQIIEYQSVSRDITHYINGKITQK